MPLISRQYYQVCPQCWSIRVKKRIYKNPKYKCELCKHEFNSKTRISSATRRIFNKSLSSTRKLSVERGIFIHEIDTRKNIVKHTGNE